MNPSAGKGIKKVERSREENYFFKGFLFIEPAGKKISLFGFPADVELRRFINPVVKKEEFGNREEMIRMFIRFLKTIVIAVTLVFVTQGCAIFVRDDDFHHHHRFHHGYGEHGYYSLEQTQVAENHAPVHGGDLIAQGR